jgi:thiol-disulfide isomerase/thioredoxin
MKVAAIRFTLGWAAAWAALALAGCGPRTSALPDPLAIGSPLPPLTAEGWIQLEKGQWSEQPGGSSDAFIQPGDVVVIDVWAYWCGPCAVATPAMVRLYRRYADQGVSFIGLTGEPGESLPDTKDFIERLSVPWPTGYGAVSTIIALEVSFIPTLFIVGKDGRIAWHGYHPDGLEEALEAAMAAPDLAPAKLPEA